MLLQSKMLIRSTNQSETTNLNFHDFCQKLTDWLKNSELIAETGEKDNIQGLLTGFDIL